MKLRVRPRAGAPEAYLFQTHLKGGLFGREGDDGISSEVQEG